MRVARPLIATAALAAAIAMPATAVAGEYPPPSNPGGVKNPPKGGTLKVCKKGCAFKKIQKAIDSAGKGTTIRVGNGTYKEGLKILSPVKDGIKLIGNPKDPSKVVLEGKGVKGAASQNGVQVNNADKVTINGFKAQNFKGNGFFVVNVDGYTLTNLIAEKDGVYGIYAFNSKGGTMSNSEAYYHNDAGYYVGQTPKQTKPKRTTLKNLSAWGNVIGYSGTNSRYVTITKSKFFNNGVGIVPNVLDSEKFPPAEENVITDNDIFWNNFNYYKKAPFKLRAGAEGLLYPVGTGILLFGSQKSIAEDNQIWGHYLVGYGQINQIVLANDPESTPEEKEASVLRGNIVRNNVFGKGGADKNGLDMFYSGDGSGNCFEGNETTSPNLPADNSTFVACGQQNVFNQQAQNGALAWVADDTHEANWVKNPHEPIEGITPLEEWNEDYPNPEVR